MHLRSRYLPRPSANSPPDNKAPPMANTSQAQDLEGLHREIHGMAEQMRIMNENNARLVQLLAAANPPPPAAPPIPDVERSHHSNRSGGHSQNLSTDRARRGRPDHQVLPNMKEVLLQNLVKFQQWEVRIRGGEGALVEKNASHLLTVHQKETKSLKDFVKRFNQTVIEVEDPGNKVVIMAMIEGLRPGPLFDSLSKNIPETLSALQSKVDKYIAAEELTEAKRRRRGKEDHKRKEPDTRRIDYREEARSKRPDRESKRPQR
ncbi:hypothetical protein Acr_12g0002960 [Actinidia rufa]|uniref:Uncharacterized protein n=1 Tax=Actinidia rufa TaxID=165716 RepID=A0A7J0FGF9_9ERIC|nr:hypothetical protein Acr_12g0002960 [Actinidia rufa]